MITKRYFNSLAAFASFAILLNINTLHFQIHPRQKSDPFANIDRSMTFLPMRECDENCTRNLIKKCFEIIAHANVNYDWLCRLENEVPMDRNWIRNRFTDEEKDQMSSTGKYIYFGDRNDTKVHNAKNFLILVWNHGKHLENRFLRSYGTVNKDPFGKGCPVHNCKLTRWVNINVIGKPITVVRVYVI